MESVQTFFLRRMQTFYVDLTVLQTLPWITLTSVFELSIIWQAFILTIIRQFLRKKNIIFQEHKNCTFREILIFQSHSTDGERANFFPSKNANFLRRFDCSSNAPLNDFDICFRAIHYMTSFYFDYNQTSFDKKTSFFKNTKFARFEKS